MATAAEVEAPPRGRPLPFPERPDARNGLYGVALSGGGMRAAVFSLGVLQALARYDLLADVDYLSTVSGGGYAGTSLTGLCADDLPYTEGPSRLGWARGRFPFGFLDPAGGRRDGHDGDADGDGDGDGDGVDAAADRALAAAAREAGVPVHGNESPALYHVRGHAELLGRGIGLFDGYTWRMVGRFVASTVLLWGFFLLPVLTLVTVGGLWALEGHLWVLRVLPLVPVVLFGVAAFAATALFHDPAHAWTRRFRRALPYAASASALIAVVSAVAGGVWLLDWAAGTYSGVALGAGGAGLSAVSGSTVVVGVRKIAKNAAGRRVLWAVAVGVGGYLLLGMGVVAWTWVLWRHWGAGFGPLWGVGPLSVQLIGLSAAAPIAITIFGGWGTRLLNYLSLHDVYVERIGQTWIVSAAPGEAGRDGDVAAGVPAAAAFPARWTQVWHRSRRSVSDLVPTAERPPTAPYPLICTTLNLPASQGPKLLDRKGDCFVIAPLYSGSALSRWLPTAELPELGGMSLAAAAAVSGAAVSPIMGTKTTRTLSIVLTLFNVRLGRWVKNPRPPGRRRFAQWVFERPLALYWKEMFGLASRDDGLVYLSDGGHFENSGLYELLRRRCKYIIAVMADIETHDNGPLGFGNLGDAIRLARVDFGVEIDLDDLRPLARDPATGFVPSYFAAGTIRYPATGGHGNAGDAEAGTLVVIKSGLVEEQLSPDIVNYWRQTNPRFPYDSTLDQQMDQLQFESYRQLGYRAGRAVGRPADGGGTLDERFARMAQRWAGGPGGR